jgi:hypothetical protein
MAGIVELLVVCAAALSWAAWELYTVRRDERRSRECDSVSSDPAAATGPRADSAEPK